MIVKDVEKWERPYTASRNRNTLLLLRVTELPYGLPRWCSWEAPACQCRRHSKRHRLGPWVGKLPWRRAWQPTPGFLPRESHGQSLGDYSPWGGKESDMTDATEHAQHTSTHARKLETYDQTKTCTQICREALFIMTKKRKQCKRSLTDEGINKMSLFHKWNNVPP